MQAATEPVFGPTGDVFKRGSMDAVQDHCEGTPFGSIGGVGARANMVPPPWVPPEDAEEYLAGYAAAAKWLYGSEWETCEFAWARALRVEAKPEVTATPARECPDCGRLTEALAATLTNVVKMNVVIDFVQEELFELETDDPEHTVAYHSENVARTYVTLCKAVQRVKELVSRATCAS